MAGLNDVIRSSTGGSSIAKPLMIALGALLASNVLFGGKGPRARARNRQRTRVIPVRCLADWADW